MEKKRQIVLIVSIVMLVAAIVMLVTLAVLSSFRDENAKSNVNLSAISKESKEINKTLDLLKRDFKMKLSKINYNSCVNNNIQHSIRSVFKKGNYFDENIRRLANEIVDQVTKDNNRSFANISSMNTNNATS